MKYQAGYKRGYNVKTDGKKYYAYKWHRKLTIGVDTFTEADKSITVDAM